jgi:hypothetical protein
MGFTFLFQYHLKTIYFQTVGDSWVPLRRRGHSERAKFWWNPRYCGISSGETDNERAAPWNWLKTSAGVLMYADGLLRFPGFPAKTITCLHQFTSTDQPLPHS